MKEWISVKERLPDYDTDGERFLVALDDKAGCLYGLFDDRITLGRFIYMEDAGDHFWKVLDKYSSFTEATERVTHWMPLPEPPKEVE